MPENIMDLDVEPVWGLVCGSYLGWRVTTDRHVPWYETGARISQMTALPGDRKRRFW